MFKPEGVYVAMMTPVDSKKAPCEDALRQYTDFCIKGGVDGLFPVSSVGEFVHFTIEERKHIIEIVCEETKHRVPVVAGVSDTKVENCIEMARHAQEVGCEGVVICPPYYYPASQGLIERYYAIIAAAVPNVPIILYNIPFFTSSISYDVVERLSKLRNIVGIKDSSGSMVDLIHYIDKIRLAGSDFNVLTGREETFLPALAAGAKGCMTACSGIIPEVMIGIERLYRKGNLKEARELQYSFLPLLRAMTSLPFPIGFKIALELRGIPMGPFIQPLSQTEECSLSHIKHQIGYLLKDVLSEINKKRSQNIP